MTQEQIVKNAKKYFDTATKLGFMTDELIACLGEEFIKAPASPMNTHNNSFEGGLIEHLLKVTKYAVCINDSLPEDERVNKDSLVKVCLLHQIGKAKLFQINTSEWHVKNQGKNYVYSNDLTPMKVGERSVFYALSNGVKLTDEEFSAILLFDKVDDGMANFHNTMLGDLLKMGSVLAIKNEKKSNSDGK